jgi:hypothetical protein
MLCVLGLVAVLVLAPTAAVADSATHTYKLVMEGPNFGVAPNGDQITITGEGEFSVHPDSVEASGTFIHTSSSGTVLATGTWDATELIDYQSYGCGVVFGQTIPSNFCGGVVRMAVTLHTPNGDLPGILSVICVIGDHAPGAVSGPRTEGVTLNVIGIINFNHSAGGENRYEQTS